MEMENTNECQAADALLNENFTTAPTASVSAADLHTAWRARVAEFEDAGLAKPEPLDACLDGITADLLRIADKMGTTIDQSLGDESSLEKLRRTERPLNDYLRVTRQIERLAQLRERAADARRKAAGTTIRPPMMGPYASNKGSARGSGPLSPGSL